MKRRMTLVKSEMPVEKENTSLLPVKHLFNPWKVVENQAGRIGYVIAWLLGVPASLLFLIFLIRGH